MADKLSAIFALFVVTWKITLKTAQNQGSKNGTQNHFSESSMTLFRYFVCIFPKNRNERSAAESGINTKSPICTLQNDTLSVNPTLPKKRGRTEKLRRKSVV